MALTGYNSQPTMGSLFLARASTAACSTLGSRCKRFPPPIIQRDCANFDAGISAAVAPLPFGIDATHITSTKLAHAAQVPENRSAVSTG
jgi:hypothetical protein